MIKRYIIVKTQFEGFHNWPDAPQQVAFLRHPHRHVFYVEAVIPIESDRQLEFFMVKDQLDDFIGYEFGTDLGSTSCETMAELIGEFARKTYEVSYVSVKVSEDNENGSIVVIS